MRDERFFYYGGAIYDRDDSNRRAWFGPSWVGGGLTTFVDAMNKSNSDCYSLQWSRRENVNSPHWAPSQEFISEYDLAISILGEDYFA